MKLSEKKLSKKIQQQYGRCFYCGELLHKNDVEIDHILPRSIYKTDRIINLCLACKDCNRKKSDKTMDEFEDYVRKFCPEKQIRGKFYWDFIGLTAWKEILE